MVTLGNTLTALALFGLIMALQFGSAGAAAAPAPIVTTLFLRAVRGSTAQSAWFTDVGFLVAQFIFSTGATRGAGYT